jgi:hypothetical protein
MVYIKNLAQTALFASAVSAYSVIGRRQNATGLNAAFVGHDKLYLLGNVLRSGAYLL